MEQFLLSPDVAVQQTAQKQPVNDNAIENDGETFNPILEEAVASQENIATTEHENPEATQNQLTEAKTEPLIASELLSPVLQETTCNTPSPTQEYQQKSLIDTKLTPNPFQLNTPPQATETEAPAISSQSGNASKAETILLQQIQQIIDEGKNVGDISIKASNTNVPGDKEQVNNLQALSSMILNETEPETIQVRQSNTIQMLPEEQKVVTLNNKSSKPESSRQEITEQFLNAKFDEAKTDGEQPSTSQHNNQKGSDSQNKSNSMNPAITSAATIGEIDTNESGFTQQLRSIDISATQNTSTVEGKFAPGATQNLVPEKELVDNLIQRFNVNPRLQTSKLTMQLHPVELGQIKIDILVKGDSISANIVAQSQQVLETLDKHMNRLRSVLEDQGFKIATFDITLQTDEDKQQNLFQEHFDSQQQFTNNFNNSSVPDEDSFDLLLNNEADSADQETSGLHVTA